MVSASETITISGTNTIQGSDNRPIRVQRRDVIAFVALAVIAVLMFIPFLGQAGMFDPTDSFFVESPREMLETGQLTVPMYNYEPWLDKPAFAFWLIIGCYKTFGINEFAARLPSAISGILLVLTTFVLGRHVLTRRQAFLSALVLACSPLFLIVGHVALTDEPLALFLTTALLSLAVSMAKRSFRALLLAYPALAVAVLCKGPMLTLGLVGIITFAYLLCTKPKQIFSRILSLHPIMAVVIILVIAAPYYVWAHQSTHGAFTETFFLRQNLGRLAGAVNHVNPWWWYIPVVIGGFLPWSLLWVPARKFLFRLIRRRAQLSSAREQVLFFSFCWAVAGFVVLSAIPTKLQTYIVPIFPALALMCGNYIDVLMRKHRPSPLVLSATGMLAIAVAAPVLVHMLAIHGKVDPLEPAAVGAYMVSAALITGTTISIWLNRKDAFLIAATNFTAIIFGCGFLLPLLFNLYHDKYQVNIDKAVSYSLEQGASLATVRYSLPSVIYRYGHQVPLLDSEAQLQKYADEPGKRWLLVHHDVLSLLCWTQRSPRVVAQSDKYWIFTVGKNAMQEKSVEWHGLLPQYHYPTVDELSSSSKK